MPTYTILVCNYFTYKDNTSTICMNLFSFTEDFLHQIKKRMFTQTRILVPITY